MNSFVKKGTFLVKPMIEIPTPSSLSYFWNFGSLLGICLVIQLITGLVLSLHYNSAVGEAFQVVVKINGEVNLGWLTRGIHANGASFFFICIYAHIGRGLYFGSYSLSSVWVMGVLLLFALMGTAFLGYVLPWGQMSFWGATVITNLLSTLPEGKALVEWVWGGFSVGGPTLSRFFALHFILPFAMLVLSSVHIFLLHGTGSSNPLGVSENSDKVYFVPYYLWKDLVGMSAFLLLFLTLVLQSPDLFMDPDNFTLANPMVTPTHIQPEWYFLFAYAILRSIPSKSGGVVALVSSILILALLPVMAKKSAPQSCRFNSLKKGAFLTYVISFFLLTWVGAMPVEGIMVAFGQALSCVYFLTIVLVPLL